MRSIVVVWSSWGLGISYHIRAVIVTAKLRGLNFEKLTAGLLGGAVSQPVLAPFKVLN